MKIVIYTQCYENYGDPQSPHWKAKGGDEYIVPSVSIDANNAAASVKAIVDAASQQIDHKGELFEEYVIGYELVDDDYQTQSERDQLEYDGRIDYPAKEIRI